MATSRNQWSFPMFRKKDPATSKLAAAILFQSKTHSKQQHMILEALLRTDTPLTARQIDRALKQERYFSSKRMPEMERLGVVERDNPVTCPISNRLAHTWRASKTNLY